MKMYKIIVLALMLAVMPISCVYAQSTKAVANSIVCPATGSSIQVLAAAASRESYIYLNTSGVTMRVGFLPTGAGALNDTNSVKLLAGQNFSDASPSIYIGRIVCAADGAAPGTVYIIETRRP